MESDSFLTIVCAWCERLLSAAGGRISHGMCTSCARQFLLTIDESLADRITVVDDTMPGRAEATDLRRMVSFAQSAPVLCAGENA